MSERGSVLVEFALVLVLLATMLLGMFSAGIALSQQEAIEHAAREGARFGGAQATTGAGMTGAVWASNVQGVAVNRAQGVLDPSTGATVCAALVTGANSVYDPSGNGTDPYSTKGASTCFNDGGADQALRVQVAVTRPASFSVVVFSTTITLHSNAVARFENS